MGTYKNTRVPLNCYMPCPIKWICFLGLHFGTVKLFHTATRSPSILLKHSGVNTMEKFSVTVMLWTCIREVFGSHPDWIISSLWGFILFFTPSWRECERAAKYTRDWRITWLLHQLEYMCTPRVRPSCLIVRVSCSCDAGKIENKFWRWRPW
jgi:hypothetical protein